MKKYSIYALMSAIALSGTIGFSSCSSSSDDVVITNPDYNPEENTVKTQFAISLPQDVSNTRQAATTVQQGTAFRGMDNIMLIPFTLASGDILSTSTANSALISLPAFNAFYKEASNSKVYADVELASGTSNFLFYGKAIDATADAELVAAADKFQYGYLVVSGLSGTPALSDVVFTPKAIYGDGNATEIAAINAGKTVGASLITVLNAVADATPSSALSDSQSPKFKEVTSTQNNNIYNLFKTYKNLTTASSHSVQAIFYKLCKELDQYTTDDGSDGYKLASAIRSKIDQYATITVSAGVTTDVTLDAAYLDYPASVNLPDGAVRVTYSDANQAFADATSMQYGSSLNVTALDHYVYPANLQYFVNSPIKVSNSVKSPSYGTSTWADILTSLYTDGTTVTDNTRSVALSNQVQYGVGRLDASVAALNTESYYDYNGSVVDVTNGFTLTGILIGGQKPVGWDFAVKGTTSYTIYDKTLDVAGTWTVKSGTASSTNYTLALETEKYNADGEVGVVRVALEFKNNGNDFAGLNGQIIPKDGTFYLVGELKPVSGTGYNADTKGKDRVFTQDHKTIATFTINNGSNDASNANYQKGLGTATNGLPDLRSSSMEIGLSVNLEWQEGLTFNVGI